MTKQMVLLPTWDGQKKGTAAVDPQTIDLIKPAVMPGMTNLYMSGDHLNAVVGVYMDFELVLQALEKAGVGFMDLGGGVKANNQRQDTGE